jgi:hypothetical protein
VADLFSRKLKKEHEDLRDKYDSLEDKYEDLQGQHDRLVHETGEQTNIRISYIEEEIESMNKRVEKLATDSYEIHSEVREIRESVGEMRTALSDIVALYKAILMKYGFGNITPAELEERARQARTKHVITGDPGDEIIDALRKEKESRAKSGRSTDSLPRSRTVPPRAPSSGTTTPPPPPPHPDDMSAVDELHRMSEEQRAQDADPESLAKRLATRASRDDRVGRVAKRDMGRMESIDRGTEGEFTRSLPRKDVTPRSSEDRGGGGDWEAMADPPPERDGDRGRVKKPRLEDLLDPE